jgi:cytoskeletal protein CcmA (bactofilin family)
MLDARGRPGLVSPSASTSIGSGSAFRGDLRAVGNLRVDGSISSNVQLDGDLKVSSTGVLEGGQIDARDVLVHGRIKAKVHAAEQLRIHVQGQVEGDVAAQSLDIEAGAHFIGYSRAGMPLPDVARTDPATLLSRPGGDAAQQAP